MADAVELKFRADDGNVTAVSKKVAGSLKRIQNRMRNVQTRAQKMARGVKAGAGVAGVAVAALGVAAYAASRAFQRVSAEGVRWESAMAGVSKTTNIAGASLKQLGMQLSNAAIQTGDTRDNMAKLAQAAGQLGISGARNILKFTTTISKLAEASDLTAEQAGVMLARFLNLTNLDTSEIGRISSIVVELGNNFAATEREITEMASGLSQATAALRFSAEFLLSIGTAAAAAGLEVQGTGTAFNKFGFAVQDAATRGGRGLLVLAEALGVTAERAKELIDTDFENTLVKILGATGGLTSADQRGLLAAIGLTDQRTNKGLLTLAGQEAGSGLVSQARSRAASQTTQEEALTAETSKRAATLENDLKKIAEASKQAGESLAQTITELFLPSWAGMKDAVEGMTLSINDFLNNTDSGAAIKQAIQNLSPRGNRLVQLRRLGLDESDIKRELELFDLRGEEVELRKNLKEEDDFDTAIGIAAKINENTRRQNAIEAEKFKDRIGDAGQTFADKIVAATATVQNQTAQRTLDTLRDVQANSQTLLLREEAAIIARGGSDSALQLARQRASVRDKAADLQFKKDTNASPEDIALAEALLAKERAILKVLEDQADARDRQAAAAVRLNDAKLDGVFNYQSINADDIDAFARTRRTSRLLMTEDGDTPFAGHPGGSASARASRLAERAQEYENYSIAIQNNLDQLVAANKAAQEEMQADIKQTGDFLEQEISSPLQALFEGESFSDALGKSIINIRNEFIKLAIVEPIMMRMRTAIDQVAGSMHNLAASQQGLMSGGGGGGGFWNMVLSAVVSQGVGAAFGSFGGSRFSSTGPAGRGAGETGPQAASGGVVTRGGEIMVGERGAEIVSLPRGAAVYPHGSVPRDRMMMNESPSSINIYFSPTINSQSPQEYEAAVQRQMPMIIDRAKNAFTKQLRIKTSPEAKTVGSLVG